MIAITFSEDAGARLREIRALGGHGSDAETIREALRQYEFFLQKRAEGWGVHVVRGVEEVEVEFR